ncbi:type I polyketide synthase [Methylobacter sp.]|uniref:type I polyketide synthase n=1 Tax=Methylobacter sp. TaxID=2051955 RepID=UPI0025FA06DF|nr:type I polyketide synthase [Methylobacter sp.]
MANNEAIDYQQLVKNSLLEIRKLKAKIAELEQSKALEEIAVIGMACQFPTGQDGAQDLDAFWQVLVNEVDAVKEAPEARLSKRFYNPDPDAAGKIISTQGGYLNDIDQFAAEFFFISPREADSLDPQQRMLLENHWRALEHAGILPSSLMSSQTGLFAGICNNDYYHLLASRAYTEIDSYMASGTAHSTAVGRLAFYLGTQGPAIAVDTACSSSLVSIHLACQSLRAGECELALASGVNSLLSPEFSINFSRAGMLSPEGRCKTFDDSADGYVRGEGCGVVVLKKLSDALRDGDNILAVIKGSATNQDGRSSGLTAPNGSAQRQVLVEALQAAGLKADQVSYVEAHGTGTSLGDPIEIEALQAVYGSRRQTPLTIGSVKSSIGHLEGAAGIAGFIKTVLMLQHRKIPKQLHFHRPNRHVDWPAMNLKVNQQLSDWQAEPGQQRIAGISSFGFGGTNAHVLVAQAPEQDQSYLSCKQSHQLLTVSANDQHELQHLVQSYSDYLIAYPNTDLADFCYAANAGRDHFQYRTAFSCATVAEAINSLRNIKDGAAIQEKRIAMLFTGQGAFNGALNDFAAYLPLLAEKLDQCEPAFKQQLGVSLKELLFTEQGAKQLLATQYAQPALYCFQVALAETWFALGLEVECFIGHSVGEYATACLAGVFSFEDGLKLVSHRGRLMTSLTEPAGMMAVLASAEKVNQALQASASQLCIAGYNGKTNTVVSGSTNELTRFGAYLDQQGLAYVELKVDRAFHSPLMAPMLEDFAAIAQSINYQAPTKNIISTKTGKLIGNEIAGADYWVDQISKPVLFTQALAELQTQEVNLALEIGPQNVLTKLLQREYAGDTIQAVSSINGQDSGAELLHTISALYQMGLNINWPNYYQSFKGRYLNLPGYPFTRKKYWFKRSTRTALPEQIASLHPLLHSKLELAGEAGKQVFTALLNAESPAFHQDHRYRGKILVPAAHYLEMAIAAFGGTACQITQVSYPAPLMLDSDQEVQLQLILTALADGYDCAIFARPLSDTSVWQCHFNARIKASTEPAQPLLNTSPLNKALSVDEFYQIMAERGIDFGSCYRLLESLSAQDGQVQGKIKTVKEGAYYLYPPMLDACFQVTGSLLPQQDKATYVQMGLESLSFYRAMGQGDIHAYAALREGCDTDQPVFDIDILGEGALPIVQIKGMCLKKIELSKPDSLFYKTQWQSLGLLSDDIDSAKTAAWLEHIAQTPEQYWQNQGNTDIEYLPVLESQALNHVMQALLDLAFPYQLDQSFNLQQCQQQLGVLPRYTKLLDRCLTALTEADYLTKQQEQWRLVKPLAVNPQHSAIDSSIEMQLLNQCGQALAGVLTGKADFLPLLFPENSDISAATLYSQAEGFKLLNSSAVQALKGWLALVPKGRKLKVLEIGAGTGGTTRHVLPLLAETVDFEYAYTDLSAAFFSQAETNFADYDQLIYQTLDISQNPNIQGFAEHDFDLVIAANVIHATADLNKTLAHVHQLLSANGVLMLLEGLKPQLWVDLIFGLTDGWWAFTDHRIYQNYPLLDEKGWQQLLTRTGFNHPALITAKLDATERLCRQSVILTQPVNTAKAIDWLVLKDRLGLADTIAAYLTAQGDTCTLVSYGQNYTQSDDGVWTVDPLQKDDFNRLVSHWLEQSEPAKRAVLNCWPLDAKITEASQSQDVEETLGQLCAGTLHLVQALGAQNVVLQAFNVITQGAQQIGKSDQLQPAMAALWGMVRVVAKEYPQFHCRLLDIQVETALSAPVLKQLSQTGLTNELQGAVRDQQLFVPRLAACAIDNSKPLAIKNQGVYLVTGAFGGMGFKVTQWLIEQGAKHLILLARTAPSESIGQWLEQAKANGININVDAVDISDYQALKQAVDKYCNGRQALAGIFHSAGVFADCLLQDYDWSIFSKVFPAKVQGSWNLHRLGTELKAELDYFVLFSSSASLLAASGLANYVAANTFIDALAAYRQQKNLPAHSINWGVWQDTGMAAAVNDTRRRQWQVMGVRPMQAETALNAMQTVVGSDEANMAIVDIDFNLYVNSQDAGNSENFFQNVLNPQPNQVSKNSEQTESIYSLLQQTPDQQQELMLNHISQMAGSVLGLSTEIDPRRGFFELGMDSLTSMELRNRLQRELDITLDATLTFKYPSVSALSEHLLDVLINKSKKPEIVKAVATSQNYKEQDSNTITIQEAGFSLEEQLADIDRFLDLDGDCLSLYKE